MTTLLENCRIQPPPVAAEELTVPLSYLDIMWVHFRSARHLIFYEYPCSIPRFLETVVPQLKQSLSLTLKHFLPMAGNLLYPLNSCDNLPLFRYVAGDSVSLIISQSTLDFNTLTANYPRDCDQFYDFMPQMPPITEEPDYKIVPLLALQVTLFPGQGICFGFSFHHALMDASSIARFTRAWASINKHSGDQQFLSDESLPDFDRSAIKNPLGIDALFWKELAKMPLNPSSSFPIPTNNVRATFILRPAHIKKLKEIVLEKKPDLSHVSSFVVATSYIWSCILKSGDAAGEEIEGSVPEFFTFAADAREPGRVDPPVPTNYFGNCTRSLLAVSEHRKLVEIEGFVHGAEVVSEVIKKKVSKNGELLKGVENWIEEFGKLRGSRMLRVLGSPKFNLGKMDFGWGKPKKMEALSTDVAKYGMSLCIPMDSEGGLEIGLSMPKQRMEVFAAVFAYGLSI